MQRDDAKNIVVYYASIPDMLAGFRQQKNEIEDLCYNGIRSINMDGMPHGTSPGRPTEVLGVNAAEKDAANSLREIETKIAVLENDLKLIGDAVDTLNGRYKKLILHRYIHGYNWAKTGFKMHASERTVRYWHDIAMDRLIFALEDAPMIDEILGRASRARK